jgi:hypothetical protein
MAHYPVDHHLRTPYRLLAAVAGVFLLASGVMGMLITSGDPFFHRGADRALGLQVNPAESILLIIAGVLVLVVALVGGNAHHHLSVVLGYVLMGTAMLEMILIKTPANVVNAAMTNVIVVTLTGLIVLISGLYGKVSR